MSGSAGCNRYGGGFTVSGDAIEIYELVSTLMGCPQKIAAQEAAFLKALGAAHTYRVGGAKLILSRASGQGPADVRGAIPVTGPVPRWYWVEPDGSSRARTLERDSSASARPG